MRISPVISEEPTFRQNSFFETLLKLRAKDPETFEALTDSAKLSVQIYAEEKAKHQLNQESKGE